MNSVERVKRICKDRKIPISKLESDLGFSNGYIGQLRKGVFPADRLAKIANYFCVTIDYLLTGEKEKSPISGEIGPSKQDLLNLIDTMEMSELAEIIQMAAETIQKRLK